MDRKHTALPWEAGRMVDDAGMPMGKAAAAEYCCVAIDSGNDDGFFFVSQGDKMPDICHTGNGPTSLQNASFIALACNSHYDLLAALEGLGAKPDGYCFCLNQTQVDAGHTGECREACAAILKAKGEQS